MNEIKCKYYTRGCDRFNPCNRCVVDSKPGKEIVKKTYEAENNKTKKEKEG